MIPEEKLKKLKESVDIVTVINKFTHLKKIGNYHVGLCCFHNDTVLGSFKVDERKQTYKCYSCGSGGDVITFLSNMGKSFTEAVELLENDELIIGESRAKKQIPTVQIAEFKYIKKDEEIPKGKFVHSKFGKPTNVYTYRDKNEKLVGYVLRYLDQENKKQILPYNHATCVKAGWDYEFKGKGQGHFHNIGDIVTRFIGFGDTKPIYGLEKLYANPNANVLIVEGEKCVDFVQALFNPKQVVVICWQSGTNNVDQVKWTCLHGRRVWLIPDNDWGHKDIEGNIKPYIEQPSPKAFNYIREQITSQVSELYWVKLFKTDVMPDGWDLADTSYSSEDIIDFIKSNQKKIK